MGGNARMNLKDLRPKVRARYAIWLPISTLGDFGEKNRIYDFDLSSKLPSVEIESLTT